MCVCAAKKDIKCLTMKEKDYICGSAVLKKKEEDGNVDLVVSLYCVPIGGLVGVNFSNSETGAP